MSNSVGDFDPGVIISADTKNYYWRVNGGTLMGDPGGIDTTIFPYLFFNIFMNENEYTIAFSRYGDEVKGKSPTKSQCLPLIVIPVDTIVDRFVTLYVELKENNETRKLSIHGSLTEYSSMSIGFMLRARNSDTNYVFTAINVYEGDVKLATPFIGKYVIYNKFPTETSYLSVLTILKYEVTEKSLIPTPTYTVSLKRTLIEATVRDVQGDMWMNNTRKRQVDAMITETPDGVIILSTKALPDEVYVNYETRKYIQTDINSNIDGDGVAEARLYSVNGGDQVIWIKP